MPKLNFGSGKDIKEGWDNLDIIPWEGVNIVRDMKRGIPRNDDYYTEVLARYSLTQIRDNEDFKFVMNEVHRVLKKDGVFKIIVPDASQQYSASFNDPMDCRYFTSYTFDYFNINHYRWKEFNYGFNPWKILKIETAEDKYDRLYIEMKPFKK